MQMKLICKHCLFNYLGKKLKTLWEEGYNKSTANGLPCSLYHSVYHQLSGKMLVALLLEDKHLMGKLVPELVTSGCWLLVVSVLELRVSVTIYFLKVRLFNETPGFFMLLTDN